ncbi:MAG: AAA family ATPase, partial [Candidatus Limisoma sp.]
MFRRITKLEDTATDSIFLFGARQTGKTTLIGELFPDAPRYDLLDSVTYERLQRNPSLLRQELEILPSDTLVVIDEIQQIPILLNEVHWL